MPLMINPVSTKLTRLILLAALWHNANVWALTPPTPEEIAQSAGMFELRPGVVVAPVGSALMYVMLADGGIGAVDVASGQLRWRTMDAAKPLAIYGHYLIAQVEPEEPGNALQIAILDTQNKGAHRTTIPVQLPSGVVPLIDDELGQHFTAHAEIRAHQIIVRWSYLHRKIPAMPPEPVVTSGPEIQSGTAIIDLIREQAQLIDANDIANGDESLPPSVQNLLNNGELSALPWRTGDVLAAIDKVNRDGEMVLVLRRWQAGTGHALPDVDLLAGRYINAVPSGDNHHLLISQTNAPGQPGAYTWTVFALRTGVTIGQLTNQQAYANFFTNGTVLVHDAQPIGQRVNKEWVKKPLRLAGFDLKAATVDWEFQLRDTAYRGPLPAQ